MILGSAVFVLLFGYNMDKVSETVVPGVVAENVETCSDAGWADDYVCQDGDAWQLLDNEYFSVKIPSGWVFEFGGEDKVNLHKRNIKVRYEKGERVEYELGTLSWLSGDKYSKSFEDLMELEVRSFRKTSGEAVMMDEVAGKVPEASWPDWLNVVRKQKGGTKGNLWKRYLLKGESKGFSAEKGAFTTLIWKYKLFVEKNGKVFVVTVKVDDKLRASSTEYDKMARKILDSFCAK